MTTQSHRRWFRFSLRSLFVSVVLVGLLMGSIVKERQESRRQQVVAATLVEHGCSVEFGGPWDLPKSGASMDPDILPDEYQFPGNHSWWRLLARQLLGERIVLISLPGEFATEFALLESLDFPCAIDISTAGWQDLNSLARLKNLKSLKVHRTHVFNGETDALQTALPECNIWFDSF